MFGFTPSPLKSLRRRLRASPRAAGELRERALRLRGGALALAAHVGPLASCARCARYTPAPHGCYEGGYCCGGSTEELFTGAELFVLAADRVRPRALRLPRTEGVPPASDGGPSSRRPRARWLAAKGSDTGAATISGNASGCAAKHQQGPNRARGAFAGCLFRGPGGCSLPAVARPTICLLHYCGDAERELHRRGILLEVEGEVAKLCDLLRSIETAYEELQLDALIAEA